MTIDPLVRAELYRSWLVTTSHVQYPKNVSLMVGLVTEGPRENMACYREKQRVFLLGNCRLSSAKKTETKEGRNTQGGWNRQAKSDHIRSLGAPLLS